MKQHLIYRRSVARLIICNLIILVAAAIGPHGVRHWDHQPWSGAVSAQTAVTVVNAASFDPGKIVTPDTIGAAFGTFVTQNGQTFVAQSTPLPTTLGGVRVRIGNVDASLFFVGPTQINFLIPSTTGDGTTVNVTVTNSDNSTRAGTLTVVRGAPGIFSAKATGLGTAAAVTTFDGAVFSGVANPDGSEKDVDPGTKQRPNVLVLYGTGIRNTPASAPNDGNGVAEAVTVKMQGIPCQVLFAGAAPGFVGLDQMNVIIPPELAGFGIVNLTVATNNRTSNTVTLKMAGTEPPVRATPIAFAQSIDGELTADDQIQRGTAGRTYFFDAYSFETTSANTAIAVDGRANPFGAFDAAVLLYRVDRVNNQDTLTLIAADDQSGGYGNGNIDNNNALLFSVLPTVGKYVAFISSADAEPNALGKYTIKLLNNIATQITYGQTISSPTIATADLQTSAGTYLDLYWFNGASTDSVRATMGSTVFDSYLILQANEGDPPFASNDNRDTSTRDSQLDSRLPASGIFFLIATPYEPNKTGVYTMTFNRVTSLEAEDPLFGLIKVPGREISDQRPFVQYDRRSSFERYGLRRVLER